MQEIMIDGKKMLANLEWDAIAGIKKSQEIKESAKQTGKRYAVIVEGDEAVGVGFADKPSRLPSAAAWLSLAYQSKNSDFILVEPLEDGGYWVCAIRKGVPVLGYDITTNFDGAVSRVSDLVAFGGFVVFSKDQSLVNHFGGVPDVISEDFKSLTDGLPYKGKIKKVAGLPIMAITASVLVLGGIAGWVVYSSYEEDRMLEERQMAANAKKSAAAAAVVAGNQAAIKKWHEDYDKAKNAEIMKAVTAISREDAERILMWRSAMVDRRVDVPGWELQNVRCDMTTCDFTYDSSKAGGTNAALIQAVGRVSFKGEGPGRARLSLRLPDPIIDPTVKDKSSVPTEDEFFGIILSEIQALSSFGVKVEVTGVSDVTFTPPPAPQVQGDMKEILPKEIQNPDKQTGLMKGNLTMKGEGIFSLIALAQAMGNGRGTALSELRSPIDLISQQQWKIEGTFYIRKGN